MLTYLTKMRDHKFPETIMKLWIMNCRWRVFVSLICLSVLEVKIPKMKDTQPHHASCTLNRVERKIRKYTEIKYDADAAVEVPTTTIRHITRTNLARY